MTDEKQNNRKNIKNDYRIETQEEYQALVSDLSDSENEIFEIFFSDLPLQNLRGLCGALNKNRTLKKLHLVIFNLGNISEEDVKSLAEVIQFHPRIEHLTFKSALDDNDHNLILLSAFLSSPNIKYIETDLITFPFLHLNFEKTVSENFSKIHNVSLEKIHIKCTGEANLWNLLNLIIKQCHNLSSMIFEMGADEADTFPEFFTSHLDEFKQLVKNKIKILSIDADVDFDYFEDNPDNHYEEAYAKFNAFKKIFLERNSRIHACAEFSHLTINMYSEMYEDLSLPPEILSDAEATFMNNVTQKEIDCRALSDHQLIFLTEWGNMQFILWKNFPEKAEQKFWLDKNIKRAECILRRQDPGSEYSLRQLVHLTMLNCQDDSQQTPLELIQDISQATHSSSYNRQ